MLKSQKKYFNEVGLLLPDARNPSLFLHSAVFGTTFVAYSAFAKLARENFAEVTLRRKFLGKIVTLQFRVEESYRGDLEQVNRFSGKSFIHPTDDVILTGRARATLARV